MKALRIYLIINYIYFYDFLINVDIYFIIVNAIRHGLYVIIIEDYLGFRSVEEHEEAKRQIIEIMGIDKIECEEMIMKSEG